MLGVVQSAAHRRGQRRVVGEVGVGVDDELGGLRARPAMSSSSLEHREQPQGAGAPGLGRAQDVALAALLQVERDSSKPSRVAATAVSRSGRRAGVAAAVTSRHSPGWPPRPTRPRSWCSWETPKRSASRTTIVRRVGHVDADLDDRGGDQHVDLAGGEGRITCVLVARAAAGRAASPPAGPWSGPAASPARTSSTAAGGLPLLAAPRRRTRRPARRPRTDPRADDVGLAAPAPPPRAPAAQARSSQPGCSASGTTCLHLRCARPAAR